MIEIIFKAILIIAIIFGALFSIHYIVTKQVDTTATIKRPLNNVKRELESKISSIIVTRDPQKIYQNGHSVGDIIGNVRENDGKIHFDLIANTEKLIQNNLFEYKRNKLKIISIDLIAASYMTDKGLLNHTLSGVVCSIEQ